MVRFSKTRAIAMDHPASTGTGWSTVWSTAGYDQLSGWLRAVTKCSLTMASISPKTELGE